MKRQGIVFVVSAPSGAGKTSLCKEVIDFFPELRHSVSHTTRPMRPGEKNGVDYHFVLPGEFDAMVADGAFAEWAEVHGNKYGTALETLEKNLAQGHDVLLEIDCQGAAQVKKNLPEAVFVFILPPDYEELQRRLEKRNTDSAEVIEKRMANARGEVQQAAWYDYLIVNDDFAVALSEFKAIFQSERCRTARMLPVVGKRFDLIKDCE